MPRLAAALRGLAVAAAALLTVTVRPSPAAAGAARRPVPSSGVPKEFVALRTVDPTIIQEMRYPTGVISARAGREPAEARGAGCSAGAGPGVVRGTEPPPWIPCPEPCCEGRGPAASG